MSITTSFAPGANSLNAATNAKKTSSNNPKNQGFGNLIGTLLGFDPTPGFNIPNPLHSRASSNKTTPTTRKATTQNAETAYTPSSSSGGASTTTEYSPADVAMIDAGIANANNGLGLLDRQQQIGMNNIGSSFNSTLNKLLGNKAVADRDYNNNKVETTKDNVKARSDITTSVGKNANALQRLLGQHGAGNSSAAKIVAPYGAALQGTQQLGDVSDAFAKNMQTLDTNYGDFTKSWQGSRDELDQQKFSQENSLKSTVADKRSSLLQTLANLQAQRNAARGGNSATALAAATPYINQAAAAASDATNFGAQFANPINVATPTYATPDLNQYTYDASTVNTPTANTSAYTDTISPYLALLLGKDKQQTVAV